MPQWTLEHEWPRAQPGTRNSRCTDALHPSGTSRRSASSDDRNLAATAGHQAKPLVDVARWHAVRSVEIREHVLPALGQGQRLRPADGRQRQGAVQVREEVTAA